MSKEITVKDLSKQIVRVALVADDISLHTGLPYRKEVVFTKRPGSSKQFADVPALPGGKIEAQDFWDQDNQPDFEDENTVISIEQMLLAALNAAIREIWEELNLILTPGVLQLLDISTNNSELTTYSFVVNLGNKRDLAVKSDSGGTLWLGDNELQKNPILLPDHLGIARLALLAVDEDNQDSISLS